MSRPKRRLIATDGKQWYVRRIRTVEMDMNRNLKIYYCDQPIGTAYDSLGEVPEVKQLIDAAVVHAVHTLQPAAVPSKAKRLAK